MQRILHTKRALALQAVGCRSAAAARFPLNPARTHLQRPPLRTIHPGARPQVEMLSRVMRKWDEDGIPGPEDAAFGEFIVKVGGCGGGGLLDAASSPSALPCRRCQQPNCPAGKARRDDPRAATHTHMLPPLRTSTHTQCGLARFPNNPGLLVMIANLHLTVSGRLEARQRSCAAAAWRQAKLSCPSLSMRS